ncbi:hypothetical protein BGW42_007964 [Actinomortierella wolfii]|nr:hypothetical protein BGW42_007964 [Actinomortierella wolfii]
MSSPSSTHGSPSLEDNAKRKREEKDATEKALDSSPEDEKVTKAEVKQIRKNLKTMPLEDANQDIEVDPKESEDMDAESDVTSTVDSPRPESSKPETETSTADQTPIIESAAEDDRSSRGTGSAALGSPAQSTPASSSSPSQPISVPGAKDTSSSPTSPSTSTSTSTPTLAQKEDTKASGGFASGGFGNTSSVSPFASVKPDANIFGSGSSTLAGTDASATASPFATMANQSSSFLSSSKPSGFGNTSSVSPFGAVSSSTNIFGSTSSPTPSETKPAFSSSGFGNTSSSSPFSTTVSSASGSVFGVRSTIGSSTGSSPLPASVSVFGASSTPTGKTFGTFGSLSKESKGSFLDESTQGSDNFDALLTQESEDANPEEEENNTKDYTSSLFANAEQIDVVTGEEDEATLFQTKGRLYADTDKSQSWKERGKGTFKVNVSREDTKSARLVMRTDGVLRLILNIAIFPQMIPLITGEKYVRFIGIEDKKPIAFLLKVKDSETAQAIVVAIQRAQARQKNGREKGVVLKESDE